MLPLLLASHQVDHGGEIIEPGLGERENIVEIRSPALTNVLQDIPGAFRRSPAISPDFGPLQTPYLCLSNPQPVLRLFSAFLFRPRVRGETLTKENPAKDSNK